MISDFKIVESVMKDGDIEYISYAFDNYCNSKSFNLKRAIGDVEYTLEMATGKKKPDWPEEVNKAFNKIRKSILDAANSLSRLPDTCCYKGTPIKKL